MREGTVVVVTGAARGLGRAIAEGLAHGGAQVIAVCRPRGTAGEPPAAFGDGIVRFDADVGSEADCADLAAMALDTFGRIDVLVNNAAVSHEAFPRVHDTPFEEIGADAWRRVFEVNVTGAFLMTRAAVPGMVERGWGRVVNVSTSKASMLAAGALPYGPSKAALAAMSVGWARALDGTGVTVNEVLPGGPSGEREPQKHWFTSDTRLWPAEVMVPPIEWLASSASDGVTGRRFIARLWDPALPGADAAAKAGFPAGWPIEAHDSAAQPG